ncbi:MAG: dTDP-4-dehydrorhamnose 3,5-epimerase [Cyanobacteria bacterium P01_D01_bin.56]
MGQVNQVQVQALSSQRSGSSDFYTLQPSDQTILVEVGANVVEDLFVHRFQTDQLLVVKGSLILVVLQNRCYEYIPLSSHSPKVVKIPPGIPHSVINPHQEPCVVVNAVLRHGPPHERDYRPIKPPLPYDIAHALRLLKETSSDQHHTPMLRVL